MNPLLWLTEKTLNRFGFGIHQTRFNYAKHGYTRCLPYTYFTYSPWFTPWFQKIYASFKDTTVLTADRAYMLYRFSQHSLSVPGDYAECGVYKGGSAGLIAEATSPESRVLHLYDTFEGMPSEALPDPSLHTVGDMGNVSLEKVRDYLSWYPYTVFHVGCMPETFKYGDTRYAFVHVDVDLYQSSLDCCEFFYPRLSKGGILLFDDYGFPRYADAEKKAVDEYFSDKAENPISLRTGQCIIIKV